MLAGILVLQVAFKRFCDNLPKEVDTTLLRGLVKVLPELFESPLAVWHFCFDALLSCLEMIPVESSNAPDQSK